MKDFTMPMEELYKAMAEEYACTVDKLEQFVVPIARCPCCSQLKKCSAGCEMGDGSNELMESARKALMSD